MKKHVLEIVLGILSIISSFLICTINGLIIGWLVGFILGAIGLIICYYQKKKFNIKLASILCIIGIVLSILNLILGLITKYGR